MLFNLEDEEDSVDDDADSIEDNNDVLIAIAIV